MNMSEPMLRQNLHL